MNEKIKKEKQQHHTKGKKRTHVRNFKSKSFYYNNDYSIDINNRYEIEFFNVPYYKQWSDILMRHWYSEEMLLFIRRSS